MHSERINFILFFLTSLSIIWVVVVFVVLLVKYYRTNLREREIKEEELRQKLTQSLNEKCQIERKQFDREQQLKREVTKMKETVSNCQRDIEMKEQILNTIYEDYDKYAVINALKNKKILTKQDWIVFRTSFDMIYPKFVSFISNLHANITSQEIKIFVLSRLGFSYVEQARMLGVTEQAVRRVWYRFRDKNNIAKNKHIFEYINEITIDKIEEI